MFDKGNIVRLKYKPEIVGEVLDIKDVDLWGNYSREYLVEHFDSNERKWHLEEMLELTRYLPRGNQNKLNTSQICHHEWQLYQGIYDAFEFCVKCDAKRR